MAIIGIDEPSLQALGRWPWSHARHGDFTQLAAQAEPNVIAWDILFTESSPQTPDFANGIASSGMSVVLGAETARAGIGDAPGSAEVTTSRLKPIARIRGDVSRILSGPSMLLPAGPLARVASVGFVDTPPGADGVRRQAPLVVRVGAAVYPSLSLQTLIEYLHALPSQVEVDLGDAITIDTPTKRWRIPIDRTGAFTINYRRGLDGYANATYGYSRLFLGLKAKYVDERPTSVPPLQGRILLVGEVADGLSDFGPLPFSPLSPLVLVHAAILENVLTGDYVRPVPASVVWGVGFVLGIFGLAVFSERKLHLQLCFAFGVPMLYFVGATAAWVQGNWDFPLLAPIAGFIALQGFMVGRRVLSEQRAKEQIRTMFGAYVSPTIVGQMIDSGQLPRLGGYQEEITAYFSDIQGYSTFSEQLPPDQLVELLNEYLTACTDIVQAEGGTLDKYIGDAIVAMYGAPVTLPDHAYRACVAAMRVQRQLGVLRERWQSEGTRWPEGVRNMRSRIGLNTGRATIGNMGSRSRFNYTMTGDNVNLAARMESGAKQWGVYVMCTDMTKRACDQYAAGGVVFRALGRIVVVGRSKPVPIHEVFALREAMTPEMAACLEVFQNGLANFEAREWKKSIEAFARSATLEPNQPNQSAGVKTNPSLVYRQLAEAYALNPPAADWDGVHRMAEK